MEPICPSSQSRRRRISSIEVLPDALLDLILKRLTCLRDFYRFGAVSRSFRRFREARSYTPPPNMSGFPWIIGTREQHIVLSCCISHSSTCLLQGKPIEVMKYDTGLGGNCCFGSSHGWIIFASKLEPRGKSSYEILLLDPFSGQRIRLPGKPFDKPFSTKVILSSSPPYSSSGNGVNTIAVSLLQLPGSKWTELEFFRIGVDKQWTPIDICSQGFLYYEDIMFYKNQLYAITSCEKLIVFDIINNSTNMEQPLMNEVVTLQLPRATPSPHKKYIAEMNGDIYLVSWAYKDARLVHLSIHKLEVIGSIDTRWIKVDTLNGGSLFIGRNQCISVPSSASVMKDCIYIFWETVFIPGYRVGVFEMIRGTEIMTYTKSLPCFPCNWFAPSTLASKGMEFEV